APPSPPVQNETAPSFLNPSPSTGAAFACEQKTPDYSPHSPPAKPTANGVDLPYRAKSNMGQMSSDAELPGTDLSESIDWETFLTSVPPASERLVRDAAYFDLGRFYLAQPTIKCYCIHDYCKRHQLFSSLSEDKIISD